MSQTGSAWKVLKQLQGIILLFYFFQRLTDFYLDTDYSVCAQLFF